MKTFVTILLSLLFVNISLSQVEPNCGVEASFTYSVVGNTVVFTNTTTSVYDDVEIVNNHWTFGDGTTSNEMNPTHEYSSLCATEVCLVVDADSAGFAVPWCSYVTTCETIGFGIVPLAVELNVEVNLTNEIFEISTTAEGGNGPYAYQWLMENQTLNSQTSSVIVNFSDLNSINNTLTCCITDQSGCVTCNYINLIDPTIECVINLNLNVDGTHITMAPEIFYNGEYQDEWEAFLNYSSVFIEYLHEGYEADFYNNDIGLHEYCLELIGFSLDILPNCPVETCETIQITELSNDCNSYFTMQNSEYNYFFFNYSTGNYDESEWLVNGVSVTNSNHYFPVLSPGNYDITLTVSSSLTGCTDSYSQSVVVPEPAHFCGTVYHDENQNGQLDFEEIMLADTLTMIWGNEYIPVVNGSFDVYLYPGADCLTFGLSEPSYQVTFANGLSPCVENGLQLTLDPGIEMCPLEFGIYIPTGNICGTFYYDSNGNGIFDNGELPIPYGEIIIHNYNYSSTVIFTDAEGNYCVEIPIGQYFYLEPNYPTNPLASYYPSDYGYYLEEDNTIITIDFGVYEVIDAVDLGVVQTSSGPVVPGFETSYQTTIHNYSNLTCNAIITMQYDELQTFIGATNQGINNPTENSITWDLTMQPFQFLTLNSSFLNSTTMTLGDLVSTNSVITPSCNETDISIDNNTSEMIQIVIGSYDPNNKLNNPPGLGAAGNIPPETSKITYTINFQNTGTAPAVTVLITDIIDVDLDLNSIQLHYTSHNAQMAATGNNISWTFNNIMLPDSFSNEPESHGQIVYSISPKNNLANGTELTNTAFIYFDFNEPIITNTALNTIDISLHTQEAQIENKPIVYPNPVTDVVNIMLDEDCELRITDVNGRVVLSKQLKAQRHVIDTSALSDGVYTLSLITTDVRKTLLIVKQ